MNNYLYYTNNDNSVLKMAHAYAEANKLPVYTFENNKEDIEDILYLYENDNNCVIFVSNLNKSPTCDALLKPLENNKKNVTMFATCHNYDISYALETRFLPFKDSSIVDVERFLETHTATTEQYSCLSFYIFLASKTTNVKNIMLINWIIFSIRQCTFNVFWPYYYGKLIEGYVWDN